MKSLGATDTRRLCPNVHVLLNKPPLSVLVTETVQSRRPEKALHKSLK